MVVVFDQDAQVEQAGQSWPAPKLPASAESSLELLAEGFDGAAAQGRTSFLHRAVVEMILVLLKVVHFTGDNFLMFCGTLRLGLQQFLQLVNDLGLFALSQAMEDGFQPFLGLDSSGTIERFGHRMQVLPRMMKIERFGCILESILRQVP